MPKRIQLSRQKGWRKPAGAIVVSRPGKFGNPFTVGDSETKVGKFRQWITDGSDYYEYALHPTDINLLNVRREKLLAALPSLRGHDLCCWCPLDKPCHADVLLELANRTR